MASWPGTLPSYVLERGYQERYNDSLLETKMDSGPVKTRPRYTSAVRAFTLTVMMTQAQADTFETFWSSTCQRGAIPFDWVHPRSRAAVTFRWRNPGPSFAPSGGLMVAVTFTVEIV